MDHALVHSFPKAYHEGLASRGYAALLPLQRQVLEQTDVVRKGVSALISAPTASGKTLLAEWVALARILELKQVYYLVPTRALAHEKAREFRQVFEPLGVTVALSTGDQRQQDRAILKGKCQLTVAVLEKGLSLLQRTQLGMAGLGAIIVDEAHLIGDPDRGHLVDRLFMWWRAMKNRPQLLALSAVIGNAHQLADWLGVKLIQSTTRLTPLREGVLNLATGEFDWINRVTGEAGQEQLMEKIGVRSPAELLSELAEKHGATLYFAMTKRQANQLAYELVNEQQAQENSEGFEEFFERLLDHGIGLHTADLSSDQRERVEEDFRAGIIRILVATSTLEQGVNLSPSLVVQSPMMLSQDRLTGRSTMQPLSASRFQNQGGRAGRRGGDLGRSLLLAANEFEAQQLKTGILNAPLEDLASPLFHHEILPVVGSLISQFQGLDEEELQGIFLESLAARQEGIELAQALWAKGLRVGIDHSLFRTSPLGRLENTALGDALTRFHLPLETIQLWRRFLTHQQSEVPMLVALVLAILSSEWSGKYQHAQKQPQQVIITEFLNRLSDRYWHDLLSEFLDQPGGLSPRITESICHALELDSRLVDSENLGVINLSAGEFERYQRQLFWLISGMTEVASALGSSENCVQSLEEVLRHLESLKAEKSAAFSPESEVESRPEKEDKSPEISPLEKESKASNDHTLIFPPEKAYRVIFQGKEIHLQNYQYRLLVLLATQPKIFYPYQMINWKLWPENPVFDQQINYHRNNLEKRLCVKKNTLIKVQHSEGLFLDMEPDQVSLSEEVIEMLNFPKEDAVLN